MTEKQYKVITDNLDEYSVLRYDGSIVSTEITNKAVAELFCDELNEQDRQINELEKENEQLKQEMLRLYNYFENWFEDMMSPTAFSEMWDTVKEDKKWER